MKKNMKAKIGLWLDHSEARIIEAGKNSDKVRIIPSHVENIVRIAGEGSDGTRLGNFRSTNNESKKNHRKQNEVHSYYKELAHELLPYDEIFIFGPTTAKQELQNYMHSEKAFSAKKITVEHSDYLTENQLLERVRNFFLK